MFSYLPSVLSTWQLPGLAAGALTSALQRRILLYFLKRTLGHLIQDQDLRLDQVEAAALGGKVEVRGVRLDAVAVSALLPELPCRLVAGLIGSLSIQLPWSNLVAGHLVVSIADLSLTLAVDGSRRTSPILGDSLLSVAEEVMHDDAEGKEIEQSIQASILDENDNKIRDVSVNGYIASLVDGLLSRLKVSVRSLHIEVRNNVASSPELKISIESIDAETTVSMSEDGVQEMLRSAAIGGICVSISIDMEDSALKQHSPDEAEDSGSEADYMSMSQAVPDLRLSHVGTDSFHSTSSGAHESVYASALYSAANDMPKTSSPPQLRRTEKSEGEPILKLVDEPILINFTSRSQTFEGRDETDNSSSVSPSLTVEVGNVATFFSPQSAGALLLFSEDCIASLRQSQEGRSGASKPMDRQSPKEPVLEITISVRFFELLCAYDRPSSLGAIDAGPFDQSMQSFWTRPSKSHPLIGHLRLRLQNASLNFSTSLLDSATAFRLGDAALYEHLPPYLTRGTTGIATLLPIMLFDSNLTQQYNLPRDQGTENSRNRRPESKTGNVGIETLDWRSANHAEASNLMSAPTTAASGSHGNPRASPYWKTSYGDRGWKLRPKNRRTSSLGVPLPKDGLSAVVATVDTTSKTHVSLTPLHFFLDLSTVDRVMPLLTSLSRNARTDLAESTETDNTSTVESFETLHQSPVGNPPRLRKQSQLIVETDLIRMELRVPSSIPHPTLRGIAAQSRKQLGWEVRAGIVSIDARNVQLRMGSDSLSAASTKSQVQFNVALGGPPRMPRNWSSKQEEVGVCSIDQILLYYKEMDKARSTNFAILGMLSAGNDESGTLALPPRLQILREGETQTRLFVDCRLPSLDVSLSKTILDGLELMADDLSLWSAGLRRERDDERDGSDSATDALRILGSRFFGTRHSLSALSGSSASIDFVRQSDSTPAFSLGVSDISVSIIVPRKRVQDETRKLSLSASDFKLFIDTRHGPRSTLIDVTILSLLVDDITEVDRTQSIVKRTLKPSISRGLKTMFAAQILSTSDTDTSYRESKCDVFLQDFTIAFHGDLSLLDDLLIFGRSPDGAFQHVEPNELTRLSLRVRDVSLLVTPATGDARAVVLIGDFQLRTKLTPDMPQTVLRAGLRNSFLLVTEKEAIEEGVIARRDKARTSLEHWTSISFCRLTEVKEVILTLTKSSLTRPELDVKVSKAVVQAKACADTMSIVSALADHLSPPRQDVTATSQRHRAPSSEEVEGKDLLSSLDQTAFVGAKPVISMPDMLEDDVPSHPDYLQIETPSTAECEDSRHVVTQVDDLLSQTSTTLPVPKGDVLLCTDIVTVRLLDSRGITPKVDYLTNLRPVTSAGSSTSHNLASSSLRVRVQYCDITLRLYAGYDRQSTRFAVEEEARRVRKRLQKIKQMLDQGQIPDDSVEEATASLFDSIHIALPAGQAVADMEAVELMQAMDDELGDQSETASTVSTWKQFIPGRANLMHEGSSSAVQKCKRSKLMRSKRSLIDVELRGIAVEYDQYSQEEPLTSRLMLQSKSLQILDYIKTSTWRTFLTGMAPAHSLLPRNAKDMVKVELVHVRPSPQAVETEVRLRARLSPIRLHVDQDALDFLKKFAAFRPPNAVPELPRPASAMLPFIQHAEVFPILIKLDYKPKRVDYNLLREGKTIELMNFFNFEGSEMTLRHITVRGISGWPRFFDTLQDMWTPDVKSNQLADVLSGISPIRSLVNVGNGVADLILLPIEQYQRDGRLGKGLKEGAKSFVKSTMLEAARIGARLATGTQVILEQAETVLAGNSKTAGGGAAPQIQRQRDDQDEEELLKESDDEVGEARISRYANQPESLMQALSEAQQGLQQGFNQAAQTILAVPMEVYERQSGEGGSRPVVRAVPIAVLKGAAGASGAVGKTLQGIQRELAGASLEAEEDKYKKASVPSRSAAAAATTTTMTTTRTNADRRRQS